MSNTSVRVRASFHSCTELSTEVGRLSALMFLSLEFNLLQSLPTQIGFLSELTSLFLDGNSLYFLPTQIGRLEKLKELRANQNNLTVLPTEIAQLDKLTALDLDHNAFLALPEEIGMLGDLSTLYIARNHLRTLPTLIGLMTSLSTLSATSNNLMELPTEIGNLTELQELRLSANELTRLPSQVGGLASVEMFTLDNNTIGGLPTQVGNLGSLTWISLRGNQISSLPTQVGMWTSLDRIYLNYNNYTNVGKVNGNESSLDRENVPLLPTEIGNWESITALNLDSSELLIVPTEVGRLASLSWLNIRANHVNAFPSEIGNLPALEVLYLNYNELKSLPTQLGNVTTLTNLIATSNEIEALPREVGSCTKLQVLHVDSNRLASLPSEVGMLTMLTELLVELNELTVLPSELHKLTLLETLDVDPPQDITLVATGSHTVEMSWADSTKWEKPPLGYRIEVTLANSAILTSSATSLNKQTTVQLNNLFPGEDLAARDFILRVQAEVSPNSYTILSSPIEVTSCPTFMQRDGDSAQCYAISGYYRRKDGSAKSCIDLGRDLPDGAIDPAQCPVGQTVEHLAVSKGFWRANKLSEDIRMCPNQGFCQQLRNLSAGKGVANSSTSLSPDTYCSEHHENVYCEGCATGYAMGVTSCEPCDVSGTNKFEAIATLLAALVLLLVALYVYVLLKSGFFREAFRCKQKPPRRKKSKAKCLLAGGDMKKSTGSSGTKVRVLFGYFQVLSAYQRTFLRQSTAGSTGLFGVINFISNLDFTWVISSAAFRCAYNYTHYSILIAATVGPMVVTAVVFLSTASTAYCLVPKLLSRVLRYATSAMLLLLFLIYPFVSRTVLSTFWCEQFPDADSAYWLTRSALIADYTLSCEYDVDANRLPAEIYAGFMILVYPIGSVAIYILMLHGYRDRIAEVSICPEDAEKQEEIVEVSFLIRPYKLSRFWFEAYELLRKLVQTSLVGFLTDLPVQKRYPQFTALVSLILTMLFVVVLLLLMPYKGTSDLAFALTSLMLLLPAAMFKLLDPYASDQGIVLYGLDALIITELVVFVIFVVGDFCFNRISREHARSTSNASDATSSSSSQYTASQRHSRESHTNKTRTWNGHADALRSSINIVREEASEPSPMHSLDPSKLTTIQPS